MIYEITMNDRDTSKQKLGVVIDRRHICGAVVFSCQYRRKKIPTTINKLMSFIQKGHPSSSSDSKFFSIPPDRNAVMAAGHLSGVELDIMNVDLLKQDVALLWSYWDIIQAGDGYEKIARLCPYFVDAFIETLRVDDIEIHNNDSDWTYLPGMPNFPRAKWSDDNNPKWKKQYIDHLNKNLSNTLTALKDIGVISSLMIDMKTQLQKNILKIKEQLSKLEDIEDAPVHELLLPMLHDLYDEKVAKMQKFLPGYSYAQIFQYVLTMEKEVG